VFFPQDGHEPGGAVNGVPIQVKKAVFKIQLPNENMNSKNTIW
jgi:beta-galactosidase beta subunit